MTCSVADCDRPVNARELCKRHYYRWSRYGDALAPTPPRPKRPARPKAACSVVGCEGDHFARGWCEPHYARWRRHGSLEDKRAARSDPHERFAKYVDRSGDCWLWIGGLNGSGYGTFKIGPGQHMGAHRAALILTGAEVPAHLEVDHLCRVRACVRPDHLEVVTKAENNRRAAAAKREADLT